MDKDNIDVRIEKLEQLKKFLEAKLEKVKGSPREEVFKLQIDKLDELIVHLRGN